LLLGLAAPVVLWLYRSIMVPTCTEGIPGTGAWVWRGRFEVGLMLASCALAVFGCRELRARCTGLARAGATIATVGFALQLATEIVDQAALGYVRSQPVAGATFALLGHSFLIREVAWWIVAIGLALATRRVALAALAGAVAFVLAPPSEVAWWLYGAHGPTSMVWNVTDTIALLQVAIFALGLLAARQALPPGEASDGSHGLRKMASALHVRAITRLVVLVVVTVPLTFATSEMFEAATWFALFVTVVALGVTIVFARGALAVARSQAVGVPRWGFLAAAVIALWVGGVVVQQLIDQYVVIAGLRELPADTWVQLKVTSWGVSLQLASMNELGVAVAMVCALAAIAAFARQRGFAGLAGRATTRAAVLVATVLVMVAADFLALRARLDDLESLARWMVLGTYFLMVPVTRAIANTCGEASAAFERVDLPRAKLVS
jgi:hypothetical protein